MRRILLATRAFFRILFDAAVAEQVARILGGPQAAGGAAAAPAAPARVERPPAPRAGRSEALTLLATLQREARFVDFIQEPLEGYSDAQIGAAARDVHRDCRNVVERLFALRPVVPDQEGAEVGVAAGFDPGRYRLLGNVTGTPPFRGQLAHHGWEATACVLPVWSGSDDAARVVAPVEVELR